MGINPLSGGRLSPHRSGVPDHWKRVEPGLGLPAASTAMRNNAIWRGKETAEIVFRMYTSHSFRTCSLYFVIDLYAKQVYHKKGHVCIL